jgi:hypothetical protein
MIISSPGSFPNHLQLLTDSLANSSFQMLEVEKLVPVIALLSRSDLRRHVEESLGWVSLLLAEGF